MMTNARWPNALWKDKTAFDNSYWAKSDNSSTRGTMIDDGSAGLASSGINMTGAMAVLNVGSFLTFVKPVLLHNPNESKFTYEDDFGKTSFKPKNNQYYLDSKLELLDSPGEWHYDVDTKKLRFIPFNNEPCPNDGTDHVRGRVIDHSIIIRNSQRVLLKNIDFFASNVDAITLSDTEVEIDEINLDSINFHFPSSSRRMLKDSSVPKMTKLIAKGMGKISVINCTFIGAEGSALQYWSKKSKIYNNLFAWNDWSGQMSSTASGGLATVYGFPGFQNDEEFIGNTLWYNGASAGQRPGNTPLITDNMIVGQGHGEIMHDGSGIQLQVSNYK